MIPGFHRIASGADSTGELLRNPIPGLSAVSAHNVEDAGAWRRDAVERVILRMREQLDTPLSLDEMAEIANLSRFHFNRVFSSVTGISPRKFLATLRLEYAKRLLLTTELSITEVCFETGYSSLGTFTSHFTSLVGVTPSQWRRLPQEMEMSMEAIAWLVEALRTTMPQRPGCPIHGHTRTPEGFDEGLIFVGLFQTRIPQSLPNSGDLLFAPGAYHLAPVPDGNYFVLAVAIERPMELLNFFIPDTMLRGNSEPVSIAHGVVAGNTDIDLRTPYVTDPPILIALPFLFLEYVKSMGVPVS